MENRAERDSRHAGLPRRGERREAARSNPVSEDTSPEGERQVSKVPPGSTLDRGMCEEKRTDDRPAEGGALNSGRLVPTPLEEIYLQRINDFQPQEGIAKGAQESDPPIVVRDGRTDHTPSRCYGAAGTAKGRAGKQRGQSTHARGTNILDSGVSRTLSALGTKAEKAPEHRFRSLARLLDRQMLGEAFRKLKRRAAPGIDGVTHGEYAENLDENLLALESRLKQGTYRAQPVKRRWIILPAGRSAESLRGGGFALRAWQCQSGKQ